MGNHRTDHSRSDRVRSGDYMIPGSEERDIMDLVSARLREQGADEFWRRLYHRDEGHISFVGRLTHEDISSYTRALWFARAYHQPWLTDLVMEAIAMSASLRGKGRDEAVRAMTGSTEQRLRSILRLRKVQ